MQVRVAVHLAFVSLEKQFLAKAVQALQHRSQRADAFAFHTTLQRVWRG